VNKIRNKSVKKVSPVGEATREAHPAPLSHQILEQNPKHRRNCGNVVGKNEEETCGICTFYAIYHSLEELEDEIYEDEEEVWSDDEELWDDGKEVVATFPPSASPPYTRNNELAHAELRRTFEKIISFSLSPSVTDEQRLNACREMEEAWFNALLYIKIYIYTRAREREIDKNKRKLSLSTQIKHRRNCVNGGFLD